jgi:hypothetical protein
MTDMNMALTVWPFPAFPNPLDTGRKQPVFNPNNHEDAPL